MTREDAINMLYGIRADNLNLDDAYTKDKYDALTMAIKALEQKTGHWIDGHCSECGCDVPAYIIDWKWQKDMDAKYCPNCGAKMESL